MIRRPSGTVLASIVAVGLSVAIVVTGMLLMAETNANLRNSLDEQQAAMNRLLDQYADLYAQAQAEGVNPDSPEPSDVAQALPTPTTGEQGPAGPGPSAADVLIAVADYCDSRGNCRGPAGPASTTPGPPGPPGADSTIPGPQGATGRPGEASTIPGPAGPPGPAGRPPTAEEIAAAVAAFCEANNGCRGADGANGADGAPGPGPTDAQIASAVESYCVSTPAACTPIPDPETGPS